jgi:hypothetical protein
MKREKDTVTIASKISRTNKEKLHAIADHLGMTFYQLIQSIMLTIVRYFDSGSVLSAEHRIMIDAFFYVLHSINGSHNPINTRGKNKDEIKRAVLFVERYKGRERPQLLELNLDNGNVTESYNIDTMLTAFMQAADPEALERLKAKAEELGYFSIAHTLHDLILQSIPTADTMNKDIKELFSDVRISSGQCINDSVHYRRKHNVGDYTTMTQGNKYLHTDF